MKKTRMALEFFLIFTIGAVWYVVLMVGIIYNNIRREWRKSRHPEHFD